MTLQGLKINFLGDSITEGVGTSKDSARFVDRIADEYHAVCRNYGISGTRIAKQKNASIVESFDLDFCARVSTMDEDADVVVVFGGTNDFGHGDANLGRFSDRTPYSFYGALHTLYTDLIKRFPFATIVIITPLHRCNEDGSIEKTTQMDIRPLKCYVEAIRETAEYYSLPVLDLYAYGGLQPNIPSNKALFFADDVHPNDAGHAVIAHKIARFIQSL